MQDYDTVSKIRDLLRSCLKRLKREILGFVVMKEDLIDENFAQIIPKRYVRELGDLKKLVFFLLKL